MNYVIMSDNDYLYRKSVKDRFVMDILEMEITDIFDPEKILVKSLEDSCGLTSYSKTLQFKGINVATDNQ